jgi:hypothetical protein
MKLATSLKNGLTTTKKNRNLSNKFSVVWVIITLIPCRHGIWGFISDSKYPQESKFKLVPTIDFLSLKSPN